MLALPRTPPPFPLLPQTPRPLSLRPRTPRSPRPGSQTQSGLRRRRRSQLSWWCIRRRRIGRRLHLPQTSPSPTVFRPSRRGGSPLCFRPGPIVAAVFVAPRTTSTVGAGPDEVRSARGPRRRWRPRHPRRRQAGPGGCGAGTSRGPWRDSRDALRGSVSPVARRGPGGRGMGRASSPPAIRDVRIDRPAEPEASGPCHEASWQRQRGSASACESTPDRAHPADERVTRPATRRRGRERQVRRGDRGLRREPRTPGNDGRRARPRALCPGGPRRPRSPGVWRECGRSRSRPAESADRGRRSCARLASTRERRVASCARSRATSSTRRCAVGTLYRVGGPSGRPLSWSIRRCCPLARDRPRSAPASAIRRCGSHARSIERRGHAVVAPHASDSRDLIGCRCPPATPG